jgi:hypothetical protein
MRRLLEALFLSLLFVVLSQLIVPVVFSAADNVPRITVQELKAKMDKGEDVVIIDVRAWVSCLDRCRYPIEPK